MAVATLFIYFVFFNTYIPNHIHTMILIPYFHPSPFAEASLHFLIALVLSGEKPPCGAKPRIELGPALQQADALPTEPRRTITEPRRTKTEPLYPKMRRYKKVPVPFLFSISLIRYRTVPVHIQGTIAVMERKGFLKS